MSTILALIAIFLIDWILIAFTVIYMGNDDNTK